MRAVTKAKLTTCLTTLTNTWQRLTGVFICLGCSHCASFALASASFENSLRIFRFYFCHPPDLFWDWKNFPCSRWMCAFVFITSDARTSTSIVDNVLESHVFFSILYFILTVMETAYFHRSEYRKWMFSGPILNFWIWTLLMSNEVISILFLSILLFWQWWKFSAKA